MCAQKLSFDYAHTLHTVRIVHNAHSVHRSRVQKRQSCDCINFVRATDPCCGSGSTLRAAVEMGRNAFGFEIDRNFYQRAKDEMLDFEEDGQMDISDFI